MDESRRNFLKKTGMIATGVAATGVAATGLGATNESNEDEMKKEVIKKIRPLGFQWETQDPFLFCVHHEDKYPKGNENFGPKASLEGRQIGQDFILKDGWRMYHGSEVPGFPGHPHRGFETITVVRDGYVDHADSMGGSARYGHGDVQWMTSGKGIQHSEMFPLLHQDKNNRLELFQIWLNLPAKSKMVTPYFKMNWSEDMPIVKSKDAKGKSIEVEILAGKLDKKEAPSSPPDSWAATADNHVAIYAIKLEAEAEFVLPASVDGVNRSLYFFEGDNLKVNDKDVPNYHAVDVEPTAELKLVNGSNAGQVLVLQGKPLNEPVVQHGPFVMNTKEEIRQTFQDYQQNHFGGWPWKRQDPVHGEKASRFARHPDGTEEIKS